MKFDGKKLTLSFGRGGSPWFPHSMINKFI
jgi:hypothetical protein